ncbi:uncharacterized protein I206_105164 [Kwoniella pini CBS 10737]|uniref:Uncharacterized protein n=1 Tax=Kwoniella pini CBS 10737 TaxID=1296096 RepID=A0A1B9I544_9TREE|nr:uncharacterized protein I206_03926 [Kwoniella pini CBS 10737]OCF50601.1 hypothetical protein I206_03926 [Kwoniella pini CBS 10737]
MQVSSNTRTYVFRSIFLPYLSPRQPSTSTFSTFVTETSHTAAATPTSVQCHSRWSSSSSKAKPIRRDDPNPAPSAKRYVSSLQQVRGHDPPSHIERQSIAQRRAREYLGLDQGHLENSARLSGRSKTSLLALQKVLQAYKADTRFHAGTFAGSEGKGKEENAGPGGETTYPPVVSSDIAIPSTSNTANNLDPTTPIKAATEDSYKTARVLSKLTKDQIKDVSSDPITLPPDQTVTTSSPSFPPTITKLLSARLFRLSVFHVISTPEYATNHTLVVKLADHLEKQGAGKLAKRLRQGWDQGQSQGVDKTKKLRLYSDAKTQDTGGRFPPDYWKIPNIPPIRPYLDPNLSRSENLTEWCNSQLEYFLKHSQVATNFHTVLTQSTNSQFSNHIRLRRLLGMIDKLEKHRGFKPDRKTANLIVGCWLRSVVPSGRPSQCGLMGDFKHWRRYKDREGNDIVARKLYSPGLRKDELRALFEVLQKILTSTRPTLNKSAGNGSTLSLPSISASSHKLGPPTIAELSAKERREWEEVVRPLGKMIIRSMKILEDSKGIGMVKEWMKDQRKVLLGEEVDIVDIS